MGKNSTGSWETNDCYKIELSHLIRKGYLKKGYKASGPYNWSGHGNITIHTYYTNEQQYLNLIYSIALPDGTKKEYNTRINMITVPSNLGKGTVLYMICPKLLKPCRVLYMAYGLKEFMSREAYQALYNRRIYYPLQTSSKLDRYNDRYWTIDNKLEKMAKLRQAINYNGKPTKRALWTTKQEHLRHEMDSMRWAMIATSLDLIK